MSDHDEALDKLYWLAREARPEATQHDVNQAVATIRHALEQRDMERSLPPEAACPNIEVLENGEHVCALEQWRVPEGFEKSVRWLVDMARTSGGTAGRDEELCRALDRVEEWLEWLAAAPTPGGE